MPIDLSAFLDQLEEWLEAQVPANLSELPHKMLETAERISTEIMESLTMHGPPAISIPFPPFNKEVPPPPPPPPPPSLTSQVCDRAHTVARRHPYLVGAGATIAIAATVGAVGIMTGVGVFGRVGHDWRLRRRFGARGVVQDGMLKDAIVILAPSPVPPLLVPLTASLLKAGYVVVVAVPHVKEAETVERRLNGLAEKNALRVLIYDTEDSTTFPPFHRSLQATLTLRFPASHGGGGRNTIGSDPYNPSPSHVPHIHAFISLYPLNPSPPSQPSALPALPTLVAPDASGRAPMLLTLYPSSSALTTPDTFANQVLTANHELLGANLAAASGVRVVSAYIGQIALPSLPAIISEKRHDSRRELARRKLRESAASPTAALTVLRETVSCFFSNFVNSLAYRFGIGAASRDYSFFESRLLFALKLSHRNTHYLGQSSLFPRALTCLPPAMLPRILPLLPILPSETGPTPPLPPKGLRGTPTSTSRSASSSDHEAEDLASSIHTAGTTQSSADSSGLEGSWVLDSAQ